MYEIDRMLGAVLLGGPMSPSRAAGLSLAALATAVVVTGCGSASTTGDSSSAAGTSSGGRSAAPSASAQAENPVDILKKIPECQLAPGETQGNHDAYGDRYADCSFLDNQGREGTSITVYTYVAGKEPDDSQFVTDDSRKIIKGPEFLMSITGDWASYSSHISPQEIASEVGGKFQP